MHGLFALAAALGLATAPPMPSGRSATVAASPATPGAQAAVTLKLRYPMTCNQPGRGPLAVTLPSAMRVPARIARASVLVRGTPARSLVVRGHDVEVGLAKPPKIICQSITIGTLDVAFLRGAGLGNPGAPGTYLVRARIGGRAFRARLAIR